MSSNFELSSNNNQDTPTINAKRSQLANQVRWKLKELDLMYLKPRPDFH